MTYDRDDNSQLRRLQLYELELLKIFAKICEENNLRYYMIGGTMLGAVRHKGFIPWDDDIDIGMPREDYKKFMDIVERQLPDHLLFLNYRKDKDYLRYFSRLVDTRVKIYNDSNTDTLLENAWMDIFPLDGTPNHPLQRLLFFGGLCINRVMYHFSCFEQMVNLMRPDRPKYQQIIIWFGKRFKIGRNKDSKKLLDKIDRKLQRYAYDDSEYVMNFFGAYVKKEIIPRGWLGTGKKYRFEGIQLNGPAEYDVYLRHFYGDYRIPPADKHKDKHTISRIEYVSKRET